MAKKGQVVARRSEARIMAVINAEATRDVYPLPLLAKRSGLSRSGAQAAAERLVEAGVLCRGPGLPGGSGSPTTSYCKATSTVAGGQKKTDAAPDSLEAQIGDVNPLLQFIARLLDRSHRHDERLARIEQAVLGLGKGNSADMAQVAYKIKQTSDRLIEASEATQALSVRLENRTLRVLDTLEETVSNVEQLLKELS